MSKKASKWKPLPPRFVPFDRKTTPPRDVVQHLVRYEAFKLMQADRKAGLAWTGLEVTAGFRFLKSLTHGEDLDFSALKIHQISALQTIFMYVCYFEQDRSLALNICLPGMTKDWYNELFDDARVECEKTIRFLEEKLSKGKKLNFDQALASAVGYWRINEHKPEVEARLAEQAARESSESTDDDTASGASTELSDKEISDAFAEVTPEQIITLSP